MFGIARIGVRAQADFDESAGNAGHLLGNKKSKRQPQGGPPRRSMHSIWFGEFMGTLVLILLGDGVNAGVTLRKSYAADSGWIVITTGWALAVLCGVVVAQAFGSPGAHLNPAITLAAAIVSHRNFGQVWVYWSAQMLGAMSGASAGDPALRAALEADDRSRGQARRVLH
jgi:hypothetical protein